MPADQLVSRQPTDTPPVDARDDPAASAAHASTTPGDSRPGPLQDLPPDEQRAEAREMARAEPDLTGAVLAARFGRRERWGRKQLAAARTNGTGTARAAQRPARRPGTPARASGGTNNETPASRPDRGTGRTGRPPARHNGAAAPTDGGTNDGKSMRALTSTHDGTRATNTNGDTGDAASPPTRLGDRVDDPGNTTDGRTPSPGTDHGRAGMSANPLNRPAHTGHGAR